MDTSKLKKFAQHARRQLRKQVVARVTLVLDAGSAARRENLSVPSKNWKSSSRPAAAISLLKRSPSGVKRIFAEAAEQGLPEPDITKMATGVRLRIHLREPITIAWARGPSQGPSQIKILQLLAAETSSANALVAALGLKSKTGTFKRTIKELLELKRIASTVPDKPNSRLQVYRLTEQGRQKLARQQQASRSRTDG